MKEINEICPVCKGKRSLRAFTDEKICESTQECLKQLLKEANELKETKPADV